MSKQPNPISLVATLEKVREGCSMHMNQLDNDGYCEESDDYVVALAFFDDYIEKIKAEEEKEAMREGEWNRESDRRTRLNYIAHAAPYDHIEERERDEMLAQDEQIIRNESVHIKKPYACWRFGKEKT